MKPIFGKPKQIKVIDLLYMAYRDKDLPKRIVYDGRTYVKDNISNKSLKYHDVISNQNLVKKMLTKSKIEISEHLGDNILVIEW